MYRQNSLITLDNYTEIRPLNRLETILSFIDFTLLHEAFPYSYNKRGPKGYDKKHLQQGLTGMKVSQLPYIKSLVERIKDDSIFKRISGLEYTQNLSASTFPKQMF